MGLPCEHISVGICGIQPEETTRWYMSLKLRLRAESFRLETGRVAKQADGSIWASYGDTVVLATAVARKRRSPALISFP